MSPTLPSVTGGLIGLNNCNPFNVKQVGPPEIPNSWWQGSTGQDEKGHAIFVRDEYSVRAAVHLLAKYQVNDGLKTLMEIFSKYAPADDPNANNNPNEYAQSVAQHCNVHPGTPLNLFTPEKFINDFTMLIEVLQGMLEFENYAGCELPCETLRSGARLDEFFRRKAA